jgi:cobalt-zinc-cadmium resistance protein CzcA
VPGLTEVNSFGGHEKQYQVRVDPTKLQAYGLALREVMDAVTRNNANVGGAYIEHAGEQYLLRGIGLVRSAEDIANIVVKTGKDGIAVYVRDVADVVTGPAVREGATIADGQGEIVAGIAIMLIGENARDVVARVKRRIEQIRQTLPKGIELIPFYDRTELVNRTIHTVAKNLIEGALIVIFVLMLLLGNWRGALLVATVIPLSMLLAATLMRIFHVSGNLMSLGAIDFGLIVDGAVIMTENSVRRIAERQHALGRQLTGEELKERVYDASLEVRRATMFGELIITVVYLPILTLTGIEGKMFRPMSLTVIFALAGAFVLSLTYVPAALTFALRGRVSETESGLITYARRHYEPLLAYVMRHRVQALAIAATLVLASGVLFPFLGAEFVPRLDEGSFALESRLLPSVSLSQSIKTYSDAERVLRRFPEVTRVVSKIGSAEIATDPMGVESADVYVDLKPRAEWKTAATREELAEKMSAALDDTVPGAAFSFSQPIEMRTAELIAGVRSDIAVKLFGDDLDVLVRKAGDIARIVTRVRGAEDVKVEQVAGLPQLQIRIDRAAIARYGLSVEDVNNVVECIAAGKEVGQVYEGEQRFDLVIRFNETAGHDVEAIKALLVTAPNGARVPLAQLAEITLVEGPAQISREDTRRRIAVELNVRGRDIGSFVSEAQAAIGKQIELPVGYYLRWGGQFQHLERATKRLLLVVALALFLIFVLLFTTFGSSKLALLV